MAKMFEMDIVPVALNSGEFWPRNSFLKYPGTVSVIIGNPLPTTTAMKPNSWLNASNGSKANSP